MKLTFLGADREVTGSCTQLEAAGHRFLIDCGMEQGRDVYENADLPCAPGTYEALLLTHAHIDHSGRIPYLYKNGYRGPIYTTDATRDLCAIMLEDSAHIQEQEAEWKNRKAMRSGAEMIEPDYTVEDAQNVMKQFVPCPYETWQTLFDGPTGKIEMRFTDVGHLLGSASVSLRIAEPGRTPEIIVFSGDIGNTHQPLIKDPSNPGHADYLVMESTYGDRSHGPKPDYIGDLSAVLQSTFDKGGNVVIPSFAVGRTQELLYFIREIKDQGLVKSVPDFPVYIDSPLAKAATTVFCGDLHGYLDEAALELVKDGTHMFSFPNLHLVETTEESRMLNLDKTPKIIISASGMCDAGRIRHHLKHNLWRANSAVVFVGFQSPGTLGRKLLDGAESVKLFGEEIAVKAKVVNFQGLSSHADHDHLIEWIKAFDPKPAHVFVVHGDADVAPAFADELCSLGFSAHAAKFTESYDLAAGVMLSEGYISERKRTMQASRADNLYGKLLAAGEALLELIRRFKGRSNKEAPHRQVKAPVDGGLKVEEHLAEHPRHQLRCPRLVLGHAPRRDGHTQRIARGFFQNSVDLAICYICSRKLKQSPHIVRVKKQVVGLQHRHQPRVLKRRQAAGRHTAREQHEMALRT